MTEQQRGIPDIVVFPFMSMLNNNNNKVTGRKTLHKEAILSLVVSGVDGSGRGTVTHGFVDSFAQVTRTCYFVFLSGR